MQHAGDADASRRTAGMKQRAAHTRPRLFLLTVVFERPSFQSRG
jgi:hypothetical protein